MSLTVTNLAAAMILDSLGHPVLQYYDPTQSPPTFVAVTPSTPLPGSGGGGNGGGGGAVTAVQLPPALGPQANASSLSITQALGTSLTVAQASAGFGADITFNRPNNVTAYTAGQVVGSAFELPLMGANGAAIMLTSALFGYGAANIPSGMNSFDLKLYNATPPSAFTNGTAWTKPVGDQAAFIGSFNLGAVIAAGTLYSQADAINKHLKMPTSSLWAYLVTNGGYTPPAVSEVINLGLRSMGI